MTLQLVGGNLAAATMEAAGMVVLAGGLSTIAATLYRWYAGERIQLGLAVLVGVGAVAAYLNTATAIGQVIGNGTAAGLFDVETAVVNIGTFAVAGLVTIAGRRIGDRLAIEASILTGRRELETDVSRLVTSVGRVTAVTLPDEIDDIDGYDPVPPETKETLAGRTLLFPRRLTVSELRDRLRTRLADDYGIGHLDVELTDDSTIEYLAVGSRTAGLGPTLAPGTAAVAVQADPPFAASSGDVVELWQVDDDPTQVAVGELRARAGDVVTVALDEPAALSLATDGPYRLLTRPATTRADREFAGVLRAADETLGAVTVAPASDLVGSALSTVDLAVVAIQPADGDLLAVPPRDRPFESGDVVYAVGRPEGLRRLESAAASPESEPSS